MTIKRTSYDAINTRLVVGAVIVDDLRQPSRVLAARRKGPESTAGFWEFPGGKTKTGETPQMTAVREVEEELTAEIAIGPEVPSISNGWPISPEFTLRLFFAEVTSGELIPGSSHDRIRWVKVADLPNLKWLPPDRLAIQAVQSQIAKWSAGQYSSDASLLNSSRTDQPTSGSQQLLARQGIERAY